MKKLLIIWFLCMPIFLLAQPAGYPKLQKFYEKGRYEKLLRKATKAARKKKYAAEPHFYRAMALYQISQSTDKSLTKDYPTAFDDAIKALAVVKSKDRTNTLLGSADTSFTNAVSRRLNSQIDALVAANRIREAKQQANMAIAIFNDTIVHYAALFPKTEAVQTVKVEPKKETSIAATEAEPLITKWPEVLPPRDEVVSVAKKFLGVKYSWTGETPKTGFDCSGFLLHVMRNFGYDFVHSATKMSNMGKEIPLTNAQKGDFIFFGEKSRDGGYNIRHVGMVISDKGQDLEVIHAVSRGVSTNRLSSGYWSRQVLFVRSLLEK
jgi:cell wall-associated NlpC family hydrolase